MKVLALTRYGAAGSSSRLRFLQFLPDLEAQGFEIDVAPFFSDRYLEHFYAGRGRPASEVLGAYWRRAGATLGAGRYDLVWLEKECFPWLPAWCERRLSKRLPIVADYDDAVFHAYDGHRRAWVRRLLGDKIDRVMACASMVVAGNRYLAQRAQAAGAKRVAVLPTVVDPDRYATERESDAAGRPFTIGWIGSPATEQYLDAIAPVLRELTRDRGMRVLLVGASAAAGARLGAEVRAWSEDTEARDVAAFDVGVMPLPDAPWARGKCGYKLIQCMAAGKPVVASPVGVNADIVRPGENGYLARSGEEWRRALLALAGDRESARRLGANGRRDVERNYSRQANAVQLAQLLREAAGLERA